MANKFNLGIQSRNLVSKLNQIPQDNENLYSTDISECISNSMILGTLCNSSEISLYMTLVKFGDDDCYRFLYQIKTSVNGKIKNIDSVMTLIREFEHEFVYADKVNVIPETGSIFVDILKKKK